ncbi:M20 family metallopeptidase [Amycolatopsis rhabdoformis]|uniref:M20 family metallopeptidase n=1 Tax=Amycolatopsis rhabdoformis TaxID=1448059 RepID=A0ABZ1IJG6_9PSEU|nr:M20 family metallopeptidase [Amycolatopsis rhabdoformis]WSE34329.1 M20 family metallopeptidase [Amycolatopsis rhabdoformis]
MDLSAVLADARAIAPSLAQLRRDLHEHPELGLFLPRTQERILRALAGLDVRVHLGRTSSSIVAVLGADRDGPAVVLRADMDALALTESAGADPVSAVSGRMHACGHDLHSAMLAGAARLLAARAGELAGRVVFVWQPGEEGHEGMQAMLDDGLAELIGPGAVASYALHTVTDVVSHGVFSGRSGASHASSATVEIIVRGRGGHAAFPHHTADPLPGAAEIVLALQTRLTRAVDVFDPAVVSFGSIHGGTAANVIPDHVELRGTVRTFSAAQARRLPELIEQVATAVAAAHGLTAEVRYAPGYPAVLNDEHEVGVFREAVEELFGADRFAPLPVPIPAGDDYARLLERVPGAFFLLGAGLAAADGEIHPNHSPHAVFDDAVLADGAAVLAAVSARRLAEAAGGEGPR